MASQEQGGAMGNRVDDVSVRIVRAVAAIERVEPIALDPPLYDAVDTDALESLFHEDVIDGSIEFTYLGYTVGVDADGSVSIDE